MGYIVYENNVILYIVSKLLFQMAIQEDADMWHNMANQGEYLFAWFLLF